MPRISRSEEDQRLVDAHGREFLEVLARGMRILGMFSAERRRMTLSEIAQLVGSPRASVRRVLYTLEGLGFVELDERHYRLTPRILTLAAAYLTSSRFPLVVQPAVQQASRHIGEICSAAVLDRDEIVMVARGSPSRPGHVALEIGHRLPAYCTAIGRVLLGALPEDEFERYLDRVRLLPLTPRTVTDRACIRAIVADGAARDYAIVDGEVETGFISIAVPVRGLDGQIVCGLQVGAPTERNSAGRLQSEVLPVLRSVAADLGPLLI